MKIAIVGCGNMGQAYARSFRRYGLVKQEDLHLIVRREQVDPELNRFGSVSHVIDASIGACDVVIIAVKPQDHATVAPALASALKPDQVVLSIMAGITIARLQHDLGHRTVVRAMPNAPAQIGLGITAYATGTELNMRQTLMVEQLLNSTGRAVHLEHEGHLDPVTALSGSGPAYFFHIVRTMIEAGLGLGLEPHVASALVKQTMLGSYHLMEHADRTPDELIKAVMSKGGTTEAAFNVLDDGHLAETLKLAIEAATARAMELSGS
ncbi:MAG TPA: pyrroline-5-carboxylate reductase [Flavobacteriales bacterium]|nr:pyrroline-5-carboxylate reductase [Flavobacteriales bacterium]HNU56454.1 pyrroline-5-carboxylate reductase [Flavobacteriales bacterium]